MTTINFSVSSQTFDQFPDINIAFIQIENSHYPNITVQEQNEKRILDSVFAQFGNEQTLKEHPMNEKYNLFFKEMGLKPSDVSTPLKQVRRVVKNSLYKSIYKIIDSYLALEYKYLVSFQAYDLEKFDGNLKYILSSGTEEIVLSDEEKRLCKKGEIILVDDKDVIHSTYYGNCKKTKLSHNTRYVLLRLLGIPGVNLNDFTAAVQAAASLNKENSYVLINKADLSGTLRRYGLLY